MNMLCDPLVMNRDKRRLLGAKDGFIATAQEEEGSRCSSSKNSERQRTRHGQPRMGPSCFQSERYQLKQPKRRYRVLPIAIDLVEVSGVGAIVQR